MDNKNIYDVVYVENSNESKKKNKRNRKVGNILVFSLLVSLIGAVSGAGATYIALQNNSMKNNTTDLILEEVSYEKSSEVLTISEAYEKVSPAVVTISAKGLQHNGLFMQEIEGIGSGFIISEDGYVLTNYHVIEGAKEVKLTLSNGTEVNADVINYDEEQDVAMVKIKDNIEMPAVAKLGNSNLLIPGEEVIAIGTPLSKDFAQTVTDGIISAVNRNIVTENGIVLNVIQTNTAINSGNSGGPLINSRGEVIGINTLKISSDNTESIGFAIPINDVKGKIEALSKPELTLGISIRIVDKETANRVKLEEGLYILEVIDDSLAQLAGLKPGDLIIELDGQRVKTFNDFDEIKDSKKEGDTMDMTIIREDKVKRVEIVLTAEQ